MTPIQIGIKSKLESFFKKGHERTLKARKNVLLALLYKGIGIAIGFAYFPISLAYLGTAKFGIFLTLTSMMDWFAELDLGIGNGLRNKLGESMAEGDDEKARGYVSTAYFVLGSIFSGVSLIFMIGAVFIPWAEWLNTDVGLNREIAILAVLMFAAFAIRFVSSLVYQIFYAMQRAAICNLFNALTKVSFFLVILLIFFTTKESLLLFGIGKTFTFALIPVIIGLIYYRKSFKKYRPSFKLVNRKYFSGLFDLGVQFFFIKVSMIVIYQTNNFLIARFVSVEAVPLYGAADKYLSVFLILFVILTNQLWAANVEAYTKGDMAWMRKSMVGVVKIWAGTIVLTFLMVAISPYVFQLWLGDRLEIPMSLTIAVAASVSITTWVNMFNLILNGASKVRLQMYTWLVACVLNIPLSIFFAVGLGWGINGIVLGTVVSMIPLAIISPLQVSRILAKKDTGIWSK